MIQKLRTRGCTTTMVRHLQDIDALKSLGVGPHESPLSDCFDIPGQEEAAIAKCRHEHQGPIVDAPARTRRWIEHLEIPFSNLHLIAGPSSANLHPG